MRSRSTGIPEATMLFPETRVENGSFGIAAPVAAG